MTLDLDHPHIHPHSKHNGDIIRGVESGRLSPGHWCMLTPARSRQAEELGGKIDQRLTELAGAGTIGSKEAHEHRAHAAQHARELMRLVTADASMVVLNLTRPSEETYQGVAETEKAVQGKVMELYYFFKSLVPEQSPEKAKNCVGRVISAVLQVTALYDETPDKKLQTVTSVPYTALSDTIRRQGQGHVEELEKAMQEDPSITVTLPALAKLYLPDREHHRELTGLMGELPDITHRFLRGRGGGGVVRSTDELERLHTLLEPVKMVFEEKPHFQDAFPINKRLLDRMMRPLEAFKDAHNMARDGRA